MMLCTNVGDDDLLAKRKLPEEYTLSLSRRKNQKGARLYLGDVP